MRLRDRRGVVESAAQRRIAFSKVNYLRLRQRVFKLLAYRRGFSVGGEPFRRFCRQLEEQSACRAAARRKQSRTRKLGVGDHDARAAERRRRDAVRFFLQRRRYREAFSSQAKRIAYARVHPDQKFVGNHY